MVRLDPQDIVRFALRQVIGMSEEDAAKYCHREGLTVRRLSTDGVSHLKTNDARSDRINIDVVDGKIVSASVG